jgi:UDP-glucose 4-epimerase
MRVLVTGGAGYIGSVSVELLLQMGHDVTVLDDLSTGHRGAVPGRAHLEVGSYGSTDKVVAVLQKSKIEAVLHCASKAIVGDSMKDPGAYYSENVAGGLALLEAMRTAKVRRIVFSSTAAVYGLPDKTPITETEPLRPINAYGETKRALESAIGWYGQAYGLRSVILRYFNAAGATMEHGEQHATESHLIPSLLEAAAEGRPVTIFGDDYPTPDGTCIRDYIHVEDLAWAHIRGLEATALNDARTGPQSGPCEPLICNLGNGRGFSNRQVVNAVEVVTRHSLGLKIGPRRPGDPPILIAAPDKARDKLAWKSRLSSLEDMIGSAWEWRQTHPSGYR